MIIIRSQVALEKLVSREPWAWPSGYPWCRNSARRPGPWFIFTQWTTWLYVYMSKCIDICIYIYVYIYISTCITKPIASLLLNHQLSYPSVIKHGWDFGSGPEGWWDWCHPDVSLIQRFGEPQLFVVSKNFWRVNISDIRKKILLFHLVVYQQYPGRDMQVEITDNVISCQRAPN